jgi:hypothetical protein
MVHPSRSALQRTPIPTSYVARIIYKLTGGAGTYGTSIATDRVSVFARKHSRNFSPRKSVLLLSPCFSAPYRPQPGSDFTLRLWGLNLLVWFRSLVPSLVEIVSAVWHLGYINAPRGPTALSSSLHLVSQTQYLKPNTSNPIPQTQYLKPNIPNQSLGRPHLPSHKGGLGTRLSTY